jgi:hypothetical protein
MSVKSKEKRRKATLTWSGLPVRVLRRFFWISLLSNLVGGYV